MRILSILLVLLPGFVEAAEPVRKIPVAIYAFDYVPGKESVEIRSGADSFEAVRLSKANIVGPYSAVTMDGVIQIHDKALMVDGKETHPVLATAKLAEGTSKALVILFPNAANSKEPYKSIVFNHDLKDFPLGVYRMINISPHSVRGSIARDYIEVKPGAVANLEPKGEVGSIVPVRFEFFESERWNLLTETRCAIRNDRRWLTCIYQDPVSKRLNIRSIPDRTTTPTAPLSE